jgi:hypothetical protein
MPAVDARVDGRTLIADPVSISGGRFAEFIARSLAG